MFTVQEPKYCVSWTLEGSPRYIEVAFVQFAQIKLLKFIMHAVRLYILACMFVINYGYRHANIVSLLPPSPLQFPARYSHSSRHTFVL